MNNTIVTLHWVEAATIIHIIVFLLVTFHCLQERRDPSATILWIFVAWAFPVVGPLLYLFFGITRIPDKGFQKHQSNQQLLQERKSREKESLPLAYWRAVHEAGRAEPENEWSKHLSSAINRISPDHHLLAGNNITPLITGDAAYPAMRKAIRAAKDHIHLQSFIIANDTVGKNLVALLAEKAQEGVRVRLLYDRFGSTGAVIGGLFRKYKNIPELKIAGWTQANMLKRQFKINLRNHRKVLVVDGQTAFMGGVNISNQNISGNKRQPIRDYHFMVRGPIVQELQYSFLKDWHFITEEDPDNILTERYFPHIQHTGNTIAQIINSGPTSDLSCIRDTFFIAIAEARKQIIAVTPYFVPPREIIQALRAAAIRGVDVRIIVPAENNHPYTKLASRSLYYDLLTSGVRIFERFPPFIHAKAMIVDDSFSLIGTANMDVRSLHLNYESNLAVYDEDFTNRLKEIILDDQAQSSEINLSEWQQRPLKQQIFENLAYLMMPVL